MKEKSEPALKKRRKYCPICKTDKHGLWDCSEVHCRDCNEKGHPNKKSEKCKYNKEKVETKAVINLDNKPINGYESVMLVGPTGELEIPELVFLQVKFRGRVFNFLLDSGAKRDCISDSVLRKTNYKGV